MRAPPSTGVDRPIGSRLVGGGGDRARLDPDLPGPSSEVTGLFVRSDDPAPSLLSRERPTLALNFPNRLRRSGCSVPTSLAAAP